MIARLLNEAGVPSPSGGERWYPTAVRGVLTRVWVNVAPGLRKGGPSAGSGVINRRGNGSGLADPDGY
jgi:hypothetical protein